MHSQIRVRSRRWTRWAVGSLVALLAVVSAGCSTVQIGRDYDLATFQANVQRGVTTQAQVRGWLGAPTSKGVGVQSNGERYVEWTYYYGHGHLPNMSDAKLKLLQIRFDAQGVVKAFNWSGGS